MDNTTALPYAVVIGAANIDIGGRSDRKLIPHDSNPGRIRVSLGGVGRNIAHNMSLLGLPVSFVTALGSDIHAQTVLDSCRELGIDSSGCQLIDGAGTSTYLFITGPNGDMELALSDMEICNVLTPQFFESRRELITGAALVVIEANIPESGILWLTENVSAPIFADPVSVSKCTRLTRALPRIHTLKPNRYEAEQLSRMTITTDDDLHKAADTLLDTGLSRIFISLGADGIYYSDGGTRFKTACSGVTGVVNATGGGDAVMAALALSYFAGHDPRTTAQTAMAAAAIAVACESTINPTLNRDGVVALGGSLS